MIGIGIIVYSCVVPVAHGVHRYIRISVDLVVPLRPQSIPFDAVSDTEHYRYQYSDEHGAREPSSPPAEEGRVHRHEDADAPLHPRHPLPAAGRQLLPHKLLREWACRARDIALHAEVRYRLLARIVVWVLEVAPAPSIVEEGRGVAHAGGARREDTGQLGSNGIETVEVCRGDGVPSPACIAVIPEG